MIDHIDQVDLLDLAADLGCISAEEQSFTFRPTSNPGTQGQSGKDFRLSDEKQQSNGLTFSDKNLEVNSNYEGNIVCKKPRKN